MQVVRGRRLHGGNAPGRDRLTGHRVDERQRDGLDIQARQRSREREDQLVAMRGAGQPARPVSLLIRQRPVVLAIDPVRVLDSFVPNDVGDPFGRCTRKLVLPRPWRLERAVLLIQRRRSSRKRCASSIPAIQRTFTLGPRGARSRPVKNRASTSALARSSVPSARTARRCDSTTGRLPCFVQVGYIHADGPVSMLAADRQRVDPQRGHRVRANRQMQPDWRRPNRELGRRRFQPGLQRLDVGRATFVEGCPTLACSGFRTAWHPASALRPRMGGRLRTAGDSPVRIARGRPPAPRPRRRLLSMNS